MTADDRAGLALCAARRAPRRRQARAGEHAHGDARRPRARLPDGRVRREALGRQPVVPAARRDARADDERPRPRRRAAVARIVAPRRRRLAFGEIRGRAAAHVRLDRPLGARPRRRSATSRSSRCPAASARPAPRWRSTPPRCGATRRCRRSSRRSRRRRSTRRAMRLPALPRALLVDDVPADWRERLARLECVALDAITSTLDADLVRRVHAAGYRVLCYTPNEPERIASARRVGRRTASSPMPSITWPPIRCRRRCRSPSASRRSPRPRVA